MVLEVFDCGSWRKEKLLSHPKNLRDQKAGKGQVFLNPEQQKTKTSFICPFCTCPTHPGAGTEEAKAQSWGKPFSKGRAYCNNFSQAPGWKSIPLRVWWVPVNKWMRSRPTKQCHLAPDSYCICRIKFVTKNTGEWGPYWGKTETSAMEVRFLQNSSYDERLEEQTGM